MNSFGLSIVSSLQPDKLPFYIALVGDPQILGFEFERDLGLHYAVGRIAFDQPEQYGRYAQSVLDYEQAATLASAKSIVYWAPRHSGTGEPTHLSHDDLVVPLFNMGEAVGDPPVAEANGFTSTLLDGDKSKKANLLEVFSSPAGTLPSALLFTASHGMGYPKGDDKQIANQGALICGDYPGLGNVPQASQFLAASDIGDAAKLSGKIIFMFACFGGATPTVSYFPTGGSTLVPLADQPFISALPQRLLSHPNGGAGGEQVGSAVCKNFAPDVCILSAALTPVESSGVFSQADIPKYYVLRNDYWNYIVLCDCGRIYSLSHPGYWGSPHDDPLLFVERKPG